MNSIENILKYIEKNTNEEIEKIKQENLKNCEQILNNNKLIAEKEEKKTEQKILNKKNELKNKLKIELNQFENSCFLKKQDEITTKVINLAIKKLCEEETKKYFSYIEKLLKKHIPTKEKCEVIFGEKDYDTFKEYFEKNYIQNENYITKLEKSNLFEHGFEFYCEKYKLNFNIKQICLDNILKLKTKALNAINLQGDF